MKKWRFLGIDDSFKERKCCLVGCVTCEGYVEGFLYSEIEVDGLDSTEKIVGMVRKSKFRDQIKCIFLPGITFGGFNVADIQSIYVETGIPVVVVMRKKPNMEEFYSAMDNISHPELRKEIAERAGKIHRAGELYIQTAGIGLKEAEMLVKTSTLKGKMPEPVRIAHLVASAIVHGESKGKV
jgi:endonuclease V-like protein UPF0215 family